MVLALTTRECQPGYSTSDLSLGGIDRLSRARNRAARHTLPVRREFSAGGVLVRRMRGRWWVALVRPRRDDDRVVWALPKGLIEERERGLETALRETREETGVQGRPGAKLGDVRYVYTWEGERVFKVVSFFLLHRVGGRLGDLPPGMDVEIAATRWAPLDDAPGILSYTGEREMAERARAALPRFPSNVSSR
jgi:8-oxo-dGTP pyrophosphatase MutT (NUDIX family)